VEQRSEETKTHLMLRLQMPTRTRKMRRHRTVFDSTGLDASKVTCAISAVWRHTKRGLWRRAPPRKGSTHTISAGTPPLKQPRRRRKQAQRFLLPGSISLHRDPQYTKNATTKRTNAGALLCGAVRPSTSRTLRATHKSTRTST
jgi:hypothetical protein